VARIRSTHPGQWTDEDFVECSFPTRCLVLALRNEADDVGVFEWKPTALKMRLLPADTVDINALLSEAMAKRQIAKFTVAGKCYGAIRNFCQWQRPKEPAQRYPLTEAMAKYVGLKEGDYRIDRVSVTPDGEADGPSNEPVGTEFPQDFPTASPPLPQSAEQREEILGRREEVKKEPRAGRAAGPSEPADFQRFWALYPNKTGKGAARRAWPNALRRAPSAEIMNGLAVAIVRWKRGDPKFIPNPATWLNQERWTDQPPERGSQMRPDLEGMPL
jgi:hypothetical protein